MVAWWKTGKMGEEKGEQRGRGGGREEQKGKCAREMEVGGVVPCCLLPTCKVLRCAVPCCATLCCAASCSVMLGYSGPRMQADQHALTKKWYEVSIPLSKAVNIRQVIGCGQSALGDRRVLGAVCIVS